MSDFRAKLKHDFARLLPRRIPLLYLILSVLLALSIIPLMIYGSRVSSRNREALQTNEQVLQNTVTRGIAQQIRLYLRSIGAQTDSLVRFLESSGAITDVANPTYATALDRAIEGYVGSGEDVLFLSILNADQLGRQGGVTEVGRDEFVTRRLGDGFQKAQLGQGYQSPAFLVSYSGQTVPVMVVARPLAIRNDFRGIVATVVSLEYVRQRLADASKGGLVAYVVGRNGELLVHPDEKQFTVGQDMNHVEIVRNFQEGGLQATLTKAFTLEENGQRAEMLGTYAAVPQVGWAVIAQKRLSDAYFAVRDMIRYAFFLGVLTILVSVAIGYYSARRLTAPLQVLTETTHAISKGDFSRRVNLPSRTEIGELAETFNLMTDDLEKYVEQLKQAAQENHELFMGSIRTKYSVTLAEAMGLDEELVYKIRISALLHDVGKIGIDDRVLKKPSGLTPEEFQVMQQHPVKGANIIRPVAKLREMIPGIELHHESLDGHGYPYALHGEEIPIMARIIAVADTLDAMTTNRPYQAAMDLETALDRIRALQGKKFDGAIVEALFAAVEAGRLRISPQMVEV
jgi:HAMP domain-containing protein